MKRICVLLLLFAGCGSAVTDPIAGRTTLTDARQECRPTPFFAPDFDGLVRGIRLFRDDGLLGSDALILFGEVCTGATYACEGVPPCSRQCLRCATTIIAAIYEE